MSVNGCSDPGETFSIKKAAQGRWLIEMSQLLKVSTYSIIVRLGDRRQEGIESCGAAGQRVRRAGFPPNTPQNHT